MQYISQPPVCQPIGSEPSRRDLNKIYECQFWVQGRCKKGCDCTYVHAFVDPEKKGICQRHQEGRCPFDSKSCHYMHLPVPLLVYETLAEGVKDYPNLCRLVKTYEERLAEKNKTKRNDVADSGCKTKIISESKMRSMPKTEFESSPGRAQKCTSDFSGLLNSAPFKSPFKPLSRSHAKEYTDDIRRSPEKLSEDDMPEEFTCPISHTIMENPVMTDAGKTYECSQIRKWLSVHDTDPLTRIRVSQRLTPNFSLKKRILEYKAKNFQNASGHEMEKFDDASHIKVEEDKNDTWKLKSMRNWTTEEVGSFIKSLGSSPCWKRHAKTFMEEQVDGATLFAYTDMSAILEDFEGIRRPHARSMSTAISRLA